MLVTLNSSSSTNTPGSCRPVRCLAHCPECLSPTSATQQTLLTVANSAHRAPLLKSFPWFPGQLVSFLSLRHTHSNTHTHRLQQPSTKFHASSLPIYPFQQTKQQWQKLGLPLLLKILQRLLWEKPTVPNVAHRCPEPAPARPPASLLAALSLQGHARLSLFGSFHALCSFVPSIFKLAALSDWNVLPTFSGLANSYSSFRPQMKLQHPRETSLTTALRGTPPHPNTRPSTRPAAGPCISVINPSTRLSSLRHACGSHRVETVICHIHTGP